MTGKKLGLLLLAALFIAGAAFISSHNAVRANESHPPPSAPEPSATITDDPTVVPDTSQSADRGVSFPSDI